MKKGDRVVLKGKPEVRGVIIDSRAVGMFGASGTEYQVKYDDTTLCPPQDWHVEGFLELELQEGKPNDLPRWSPKKCECGVKFVRHGGRHSTWCPLA